MPELFPELAEEMRETRRAIDQMELKFARLAAKFSELWTAEPDCYFEDPALHIRDDCHMTSHAVRTAIAVGARASADRFCGGFG